MNFFCDSGGRIFHVDPERVFQGSAGYNTIRFIGQFPSSSQVLVAYKLPNGVWTNPYYLPLAQVSELNEVQGPNGGIYSVWEGKLGAVPKVENGIIQKDDNGNVIYQLDYTLTENYGDVTVQFYVYAASVGTTQNGLPAVLTGALLATASSSFTVEKGVPPQIPEFTGDTAQALLAEILAALSGVNTAYNGVNQDVEGLQEQVSANTEKLNTLDENFSSFQQSTNAEITELNQDVEGLQESVKNHGIEIYELKDGQTGHGVAIYGLQTDVGELQQSTSAAWNNIRGLQDEVGGSLGATLDFMIDNQTFVLTAVLKAKNGYVLSSNTIDLPLESVVVGGSYDEDAKTLVLRLQNGNNITIPVGDLVDGLISESEKGQPNGVATLGPDGIIPAAQLPTVKEPTWELINSVTVAPDTDGSLPQYVNFTEDSDGNPFELTDFYVYMRAGFTDSNSTVYMSINGVQSYYNFDAQFNKTDLRSSVILKQNLSNGVIMFAGSQSLSGISVDNSQNRYQIRFSVPPHASTRKIVNSVSLFTLLGTNKTWREGSSFELWGVRK